MDTAKAELAPPPLAVIAAGESAMRKSCGKWTVKVRFPECVSPADVPVAVTMKLPAEIVAGMERMRVRPLPAATLNGEAGDVVTPAGNPEIVIVTGSVNPFSPVIDTVSVEVESPASAVIAAGETVMLKSLAGDGEVGVDPPPQPTKLPTHTEIHAITKARTGIPGGLCSCVVSILNAKTSSILRARGQRALILLVWRVTTTFKSRYRHLG